ncbi:MAG: hypothetical protein HY205_07735, partial [Nitrospirae bacterium]|nr:hypothetical protein [Nitrospirota bacterium]
LIAALKALTPDERAKIVADEAQRWAQYRTAFVASGLGLKHRGLIAGLARSGKVDPPDEYRPLLETFLP